MSNLTSCHIWALYVMYTILKRVRGGVHEWKKGSFEFENYPSFSFKRADIDYITNYKINQNVRKKNICLEQNN